MASSSVLTTPNQQSNNTQHRLLMVTNFMLTLMRCRAKKISSTLPHHLAKRAMFYRQFVVTFGPFNSVDLSPEPFSSTYITGLLAISSSWQVTAVDLCEVDSMDAWGSSQKRRTLFKHLPPIYHINTGLQKKKLDPSLLEQCYFALNLKHSWW